MNIYAANSRFTIGAFIIFLMAGTLLAPVSVQGQASPSSFPSSAAIQNYLLPNGMEVVLAPQQGAQKVFVGIAFKSGTDIQTSKTAGLFGLLEQLTFRGRADAPGEPEPAAALEAIGASDVSGGISRDGFSFSYLVEPDQLRQGLDTLAYLFSELRLDTAFSDPSALAAAKEACTQAAARQEDDPEAVYNHAVNKKLFSSGAWRLDVEGPESVLNQATEASLESLAEQWLVPNNAALIVCGAFAPEDAKTMVESSFSDGEKEADPWKSAPKPFPKPGVARPTFMVYPDPSVIPGQAKIEMRYRGPDISSGKAATAILWAEMASSEDGRLAAAIKKGMPKGSSPSEIAVHYEAKRNSSVFSISTTIAIDAKANPADSAMTFKEIVRGSEAYALKTNAAYFSAKDYEKAKAALMDRREAQLSDPQSAGTLIGEAWTSGGYAWFSQWPDKVGKLTAKDMQAFADEYFMKNLEIVAVRLNPAEYEKRKKTFTSYGFELISPEKAFWWQ
ncbi:MAG: insulinase family protein [Spirochaetaceae bacterium]|nr:insulinase family protein [Spirochaetaceae bacterium]